MKRTREEIKDVAAAVGQLERAERDRDNTNRYFVSGVVIARDLRGTDPVRIERGGNSGTGGLSSFGFEDDMQDILNKAFHDIFLTRVAAARQKLKDLGIELED